MEKEKKDFGPIQNAMCWLGVILLVTFPIGIKLEEKLRGWRK